MSTDRPTQAPATQPAPLGRTPRRKEQSDRLWKMTAAERVAAMRAGDLSMQQCCEWAALRPDEVPLINNEFEFLAAYDAERHDD
jgi:hypothetical protein